MAFFKRAASYGDVYVGIGSDKSVLTYKNRHVINPEEERLFMVKSIKYVKDAWINKGVGDKDFMEDLEQNHAIGFDMFIVNEDADFKEKQEYCKRNNIEYLVLKRTPETNLIPRSSTALREYHK